MRQYKPRFKRGDRVFIKGTIRSQVSGGYGVKIPGHPWLFFSSRSVNALELSWKRLASLKSAMEFGDIKKRRG